ncbi:MAG: peptide MFS transporter [Candidatus Saccharimonas sp.]|nr:peptide MFS transporter [Planctomycetaceae bacterium]
MTEAAPSLPVAGADSTTLFGHPRGLFLLFCVEMWERFSYYGMRALLVLYLIAVVDPQPDANGFVNPGRGWSKAEASVLYGWYTGLAYLLPMAGGIIADKLIGTHRSMVLGGVLISLGHIVLAVSGLGELAHNDLGMSLFVFGLVLIILGTGHFKPCVSVMVGQLYGEKDPRRDGAFTIFYMGINLGAFLCAFVCGTLGEKVGWHIGFGSAAVGMIAGLAMYLIWRPKFLAGVGESPSPRGAALTWLWLPLSIAISAAIAWMYSIGFFEGAQQWFNQLEPWQSNGMIFGMLWAALIGSILFTAIQSPEDRGPTASIFIFLTFNIFFWLAFEQAGSSMNVFANEKTDRHLGGWEMPATWLQSVNPGVIILMGPLFAGLWTWLGKRRMNPSQPAKIGIGLILLGIGFGILTWGASTAVEAGAKANLLFLLWAYVFHTLGELCLSPTGLSYVTKAAPVRYVSLLMGIWFLSSFVANLAGGLIASRVEAIESGKIQLPWHFGGQADFFFLFVVSSLGPGLLILLLTPWLKKLIAGREE